MSSLNEILIVEGLRKLFAIGKGFLRPPRAWVKAVDGIGFSVLPGETFAVVGESGCGKTTLGRLILGLEEPTAGRVVFEGRDLRSLNGRERRRLMRQMQIIFQDPYSSLNRRMTVGRIIGEGLAIHEPQLSAKERLALVTETMDVVGLRPEHVNRYPHQFSGGQRQRIGVARSLILRPRLIIADEPVSALDVSIQAQILNLLVKLQNDFRLTYLFISHDLSVVRHISERVAVMYLGRLAELSPSTEIYDQPLHPYAQALISAAPVANPTARRDRTPLGGDVPSPIDVPPGCSFHPRCPCRGESCDRLRPELTMHGPGRWVACHYPLH